MAKKEPPVVHEITYQGEVYVSLRDVLALLDHHGYGRIASAISRAWLKAEPPR